MKRRNQLPSGGFPAAISKKKKTWYYYLWRDKWLYLMLVPVLAYYIIFRYVPMAGLSIAFKNYNVFQGILKSPWIGFDVFKGVFANNYFWLAARNTLVLNLVTLCIEFPFTILLSLMLNEVRNIYFKKFSQSLLYLPHFISWVVVAGIATNLFTVTGRTINNALSTIGIGPIPFLSSEKWWVFTYVVTSIWKEIGWGTIIYLAARIPVSFGHSNWT
ncbi:MAG: binding-protein-dependent transport system inner rane component [Clostridiales bacterium]|jgi:putative aldouronate transport system permease protein|nr:binding-protein-dependent transport system inner rane component [Clostridiales bacterium]